MAELTSRERVLKLFAKEAIDRMPCFSGMGMVTVPAIETLGLRFSQVHFTAENMAGSAMRSMEMFGFDAAVVPYDLGILPEALGLGIKMYEDSESLTFPTIPKKWGTLEEVQIPDDYLQRGRMPVLDQAIKLLKEKIGETHAVGTWILGPFTLASQLVELNVFMKMTKKQPEKVKELLNMLTNLIIELANHYRRIGADYITIREMSTGTDLLSPRMWGPVVQPNLQKIFQAIPFPKILHICGSTDAIIEMMNQCGADALSVDNKNTLAESRKKIGDDVLLFGDYHGFELTGQASLEEISQSIRSCVESGVDAVWPGCDIWPEVREENLHAINNAIRALGRAPTPVVGRL